MSSYDKMRYEQLPWTEKYRPMMIDDLILDEKLKLRIKQYIHEKNIPNFIFTGPPGIGKTCTIRSIAGELFGGYINRCVLELNASDDRGIKSIQGDIINFCKAKLVFKEKDLGKYANFKLIILDEADNMVDRTQPQINTIMETYKDTVRFAFTCNSSSNIIESIQSKCLILRYMRLSKDLICKKLISIVEAEHISYQKDAILQVSDLAHGDMRTAVNMLQLVYNKKEKIKLEYVNDLCDLPQQVIIKKMFDFLLHNDLKSGLTVMYELKNNGYSGSDITLGMMYTLKSEICNDIPENIKINIFYCVCMTAYRISKGVDSILQLASCLVDIIKMVII